MDADLELLGRWRAGDQRAGQDLFARHFADIYRFLENKAGDAGSELAQKTFLACVEARDQFRAQSSFRTYLFTIARHQLYRYLRSLRRDDQVDFGVTSIAEIATSPGSRLVKQEQVEHLRAALEQLPADQQVLLEMHYWHDVDAAGLAEVFETTPGAIRVRLLRARRALRDQMERVAPGGSGAMSGADSDRLVKALASEEDSEAD